MSELLLSQEEAVKVGSWTLIATAVSDSTAVAKRGEAGFGLGLALGAEIARGWGSAVREATTVQQATGSRIVQQLQNIVKAHDKRKETPIILELLKRENRFIPVSHLAKVSGIESEAVTEYARRKPDLLRLWPLRVQGETYIARKDLPVSLREWLARVQRFLTILT